MFTIEIKPENVLLKDKYKLIKNTTSVKNQNGETKKYYAYSCSFPYVFVEMFNFPEGIYFYEYNNRYYITDVQPNHFYDYKYVKLNTRKNNAQKTSKENEKKPWSKLIRVPKTIMGEMDNNMWLEYTLHCNKKDHVSRRLGLLEVGLSNYP